MSWGEWVEAALLIVFVVWQMSEILGPFMLDDHELPAERSQSRVVRLGGALAIAAGLPMLVAIVGYIIRQRMPEMGRGLLWSTALKPW